MKKIIKAIEKQIELIRCDGRVDEFSTGKIAGLSDAIKIIKELPPSSPKPTPQSEGEEIEAIESDRCYDDDGAIVLYPIIDKIGELIEAENARRREGK